MLKCNKTTVATGGTTMVRAIALLFVLLATGPALGDPLSDILADPGPLMCRPTASPAAGCFPVQLAAASCGQTCYDDQNVCRQGCDRVYRGGGTDHEKCAAACSTTYSRCSTRCNGQ
jgi:hypothetical protein